MRPPAWLVAGKPDVADDESRGRQVRLRVLVEREVAYLTQTLCNLPMFACESWQLFDIGPFWADQGREVNRFLLDFPGFDVPGQAPDSRRPTASADPATAVLFQIADLQGRAAVALKPSAPLFPGHSDTAAPISIYISHQGSRAAFNFESAGETGGVRMSTHARRGTILGGS